MKPLTDKMRQRLDAAMTYVLDETKAGTLPGAVIKGLVANHGATYGYGTGATYHLRCASVHATNTAGDDRAILRAWRRNALIRSSQIL